MEGVLGKNHFTDSVFFNNILFCLSLYSEISLLVAESFGILRLSINGGTPVTLTQFDATALNFYVGLDYDYRYIIITYTISLCPQLKRGTLL